MICVRTRNVCTEVLVESRVVSKNAPSLWANNAIAVAALAKAPSSDGPKTDWNLIES